MAGLVRLRSLQSLVSRLSVAPITRTQQLPALCRAVGTSSTQKSDTSASITSKAEDACKPKKIKPWVSYGFSDEDQEVDNHLMHLTVFVAISLCFCFGGWLLIYIPDFRQRDWMLREAYLVLREREAKGLPPIDPNLVDPAKIKLPTDEELGDTEIII